MGNEGEGAGFEGVFKLEGFEFVAGAGFVAEEAGLLGAGLLGAGLLGTGFELTLFSLLLTTPALCSV